MTKNTYRQLWIATLLVAGTGIIYGWMRYLATPSDPYAIVNHPWQPHLQHAHILLAPLLTFIIGQLWISHARPHLRTKQKKGRRSGITLLLLATIMILSGYLLQTTITPILRTLWIYTHGISSTLWLLILILHQKRNKESRTP